MRTGSKEHFLWGSIVLVLLLITSTSSYYAFLNMVHDRKAEKVEEREKQWGGKSKSVQPMNILFMGVDNVDGTSRSDTLILANINPKLKSVRLLSIPRDTRVYIESKNRYDKITHAHVYGGPDLSVEVVKKSVGVPVDNYIKVDFAGFERVVDALGGITLNIEKRMQYTDNAGGLKIDLKPGYQHLDGKRALEYVRFRHDAMGDIGRVGRQEEFLKAIAAEAFKPSNFLTLPKVIRETMRIIETDMSIIEILALVRTFKDFDTGNMESEILPGAPEYINGISYWVPDNEKVAEAASKLMGNNGGTTCTVDVLNGTSVPGAARELADRLSSLGLEIGEVGNAEEPNEGKTVIIDKTGESYWVAKVFDVLDPDCADYSMELTKDSASDIVIIIGNDYRLR